VDEDCNSGQQCVSLTYITVTASLTLTASTNVTTSVVEYVILFNCHFKSVTRVNWDIM